VSYSDPYGLCDDPQDPKCKEGVVLTLSVSASAAHGVGGNVEAGVAVNLKTGDAAAYLHFGPTAGHGAAAGVELAVQKGSIEGAVGRTGDPMRNGVEVEAGGAASGQVVLASGNHPTPAGAGGGLGPGIGVFANYTAVAVMTRTVNLYERIRESVSNYIERSIRSGRDR
jgi:hypothetical protein